MPRNSISRSPAHPDDDHGFYRLADVLHRIPVSERTWWRNVRSGRYPRPVKISPNVDGWRKREIHELCQELAAAAVPEADQG